MMKPVLILCSLIVLCFACKKDDSDYAAIDKQNIEKYIQDKSLTASSTAEGIYYVVTKAGSSSHPTSTSTVKVHYTGYLTDGTVFDQTTGTAAEFRLSSTIRGWQIGIPLFGKGGQGKILIPSDYGYGASAIGKIPAHSVLIFDIVLSDFQ